MGERKQPETTSVNRAQEIVESMMDPVALVNNEGKITYVNRPFTKLFGFSRKEAVNRSPTEFVVKRDVSKVTEAIKETLEKGSLTNFECIIKTKDKKEIPVLVNLTTIKGSEDEITDIIAVVRDITGRKETEKALKESEKKYRHLVERANDGICIIQAEIVKYANPCLAEMWGGNVEEIIGTSFTDYVYPDELPKVADRYRQRMAGEKVKPVYETVLKSKDGNKVYAELNASKIIYQGEPANLVIVRDITERKKAEEKIKRYRIAVEASDDSVYMIDTNYCYVFANGEHLSRLFEDDKISKKRGDEIVGEKYENIHSTLKKNLKFLPKNFKKSLRQVKQKGKNINF